MNIKIVGGIVVLVLVVGGFFYWKSTQNQDYEETVIQAGDDVSEKWLDELKNELSKKYKLQSSVDKLDTETDAQVVVIVGSFDNDGKSMVKEVEATPTPEEETTDETGTPTPTEEASETETPAPSPT